MRNRTYGGVRGRKTKVGRKLLRFPPTRFFEIFSLLLKYLILVRNNEFVSLTMDIDDFNLWIILQVLAEFGNVNIH